MAWPVAGCCHWQPMESLDAPPSPLISDQRLRCRRDVLRGANGAGVDGVCRSTHSHARDINVVTFGCRQGGSVRRSSRQADRRVEGEVSDDARP